ncbi:DNA-binding protein [Acinetobacter thermotolerans]|uniref:helix-turn-helix transcriptional regulator n=1 Tax=Acinetobacter thermotolerans TaxID=3151487 RepID=UPI00325ADC46
MSRLTKLDKMTQEEKTAVIEDYRNAPDDAMFPPEAIALTCHISLSLLQKMRCEGTGPVFSKLSAKTILYKKEDVLNWITEREQKRTI